MSRPVSVTRYAAKDGSLHDSPSAADQHDNYKKERRQIEAVTAIIDEPIRRGALSPQCKLFDGRWNDDELDYDRGALIESVSLIIINHWQQINGVLAATEPQP